MATPQDNGTRDLPVAPSSSLLTYRIAVQQQPPPSEPAAPRPRSPIIDDSPQLVVNDADFDIVATYRRLLETDSNLTKPVAAIESIIELLNTTASSTVFETIDLVKTASDRLRNSVANPIPLTAGTDLFQQYLVSSLRQQDGNFDAIRAHLLRNGRLFADRANTARHGIAEAGWRFVSEGKCVLTHGASRSVIGILETAVQKIGGKFRVVYVRDETRPRESDRVVRELREKGIPVAEIPEAAVAHVMGLLRQVNLVIVGAEAIASNGGIISRMGTLQIAKLASTHKIPFYVAAETHKFARKHVMDQEDMGFKQDVLDFSTKKPSKQAEDAVDFTHPRLITSLITENGVKLPGYVIEQLLDIYGSLNRL
ncbi:Fc.00g078640.m01.CDS01 [Cosmosporella sp. VM-42]